jgi:thiamine-phosphate diphosphorylase
LSPREFYGEAEEALRVARSFGAKLVINDRADVALALGADGVHVGQDDMPPGAVRALLGEGAVVGCSTHSDEQAVAAAALPVSYVAIGPVFRTSSKENPDPSVGTEGVRRVREAVGRVPLVAIGGITLETARAALEAGADSVAVIGALLSTPDPAEITRRTRAFLAGL